MKTVTYSKVSYTFFVFTGYSENLPSRIVFHIKLFRDRKTDKANSFHVKIAKTKAISIITFPVHIETFKQGTTTIIEIHKNPYTLTILHHHHQPETPPPLHLPSVKNILSTATKVPGRPRSPLNHNVLSSLTCTLTMRCNQLLTLRLFVVYFVFSRGYLLPSWGVAFVCTLNFPPDIWYQKCKHIGPLRYTPSGSMSCHGSHSIA